MAPERENAVDKEKERGGSIVWSILAGLAGVPATTYLAKKITMAPIITFAGSIGAALLGNIIKQIIDKKDRGDIIQNSLINAAFYGLGGALPVFIEQIVPDPIAKVIYAPILTAGIALITLNVWNWFTVRISHSDMGFVVFFLMVWITITTGCAEYSNM